MSSISSQITSLQTQTAIQESKTESTSTNDVTDSNMFLKLMLKQMEQQDPTEPTDNSEWLAQMAQYSSLEAMNNLNTSFSEVSSKISDLEDQLTTSNVISQTLSLVGKDVTVTQGNSEISGKVEEVSFKDGEGMVTIDGNQYSLSSVSAIRP